MLCTIRCSVIALLFGAGALLLPAAPARAQGGGCQSRSGGQTGSTNRSALQRTTALSGQPLLAQTLMQTTQPGTSQLQALQQLQSLRGQVTTARQQLRTLQQMVSQQNAQLTAAELQTLALQMQALRTNLQLVLLQNGQLTPAQLQAFALQVQAAGNVLQAVGQ
jgi:hypothetical protein